MLLIQPLLIAALIGVAVVHGRTVSTRLLSRLATLAFVALGIVFVLDPDLTTEIAHRVGVGRGTDLILYALFPATISMFLHLYRRHRKTEEKLTDLARAIAITQARKP